MTTNNREQNPDEQVYQGSKNKSEELPEDHMPDYDEASEESFPASDPPATMAGVTGGEESADH